MPTAGGENTAGNNEFKALRDKLLSDEALTKMFAMPEDGNQLAGDAWVRLKMTKELYEAERTKIVEMIQGLMANVFDALLVYHERRGGVVRESKQHIEEDFKDVFNSVDKMGDAIKMHDNPYSNNPKGEVFQTEELLQLRGFLDTLKKIDPAELVDMAFENQDFIQMLTEERGLDGKGKGKQDSRMLHPPKDLENSKEVEEYKGNMVDLMNFILGRTSVSDEKSKSDFRQLAEKKLWEEIVRGLDFEQKTDLIVAFLNSSGETPAERTQNTKDFIARAIIAGAMTRRQAMDIYEMKDRNKDFQYKTEFESLGSDFGDYLNVCVKAKVQIEEGLKKNVEFIEGAPKIKNAASYFFDFWRLGAETVGRCGMLTAVLNGFMTIADNITSKGKDDTWGSVAIKSVQDIATNKYVIGGAAVGLWGYNEVYPFVTEWANKPSTEEKGLLERSKEEKFLKEQAENHNEIIPYFLDIYDSLAAKGDENAALAMENKDENIKGSSVKKELGVPYIYPKDIEEIAKRSGKVFNAGLAGFPNQEIAYATICRMFGSCRNVFELKTQRDVKKYLKDRKIFSVEN